MANLQPVNDMSENLTSSILFSVVIPTYHRNDLLAKCLDQLAPGKQTLAFDFYEVIVTDDGRDSTAEEMIRDNYPWAKWTAGSRRGPAANRNNGSRLAKGEWLVFTDDDCLPDPGWLASYAEATNGNAKVLEGSIYPIGDPDQDLAECPVNLTGGLFWSANIAVRRDLFEQVGGFDANYPIAAHEDQDLKIRLETLSSIYFIAEARVGHPVRLQSINDTMKSMMKRCRAWAYHALKNKKELRYNNPTGIVLAGYFSQGLALIRNMKKGHIKACISNAMMIIVGMPYIGLSLWILERKGISKV